MSQLSFLLKFSSIWHGVRFFNVRCGRLVLYLSFKMVSFSSTQSTTEQRFLCPAVFLQKNAPPDSEKSRRLADRVGVFYAGKALLREHVWAVTSPAL